MLLNNPEDWRVGISTATVNRRRYMCDKSCAVDTTRVHSRVKRRKMINYRLVFFKCYRTHDRFINIEYIYIHAGLIRMGSSSSFFKGYALSTSKYTDFYRARQGLFATGVRHGTRRTLGLLEKRKNRNPSSPRTSVLGTRNEVRI